MGDYEVSCSDLDKFVVKKAVELNVESGIPRMRIRHESACKMGLGDAIIQKEQEDARYEATPDAKKSTVTSILDVKKAASILGG